MNTEEPNTEDRLAALEETIQSLTFEFESDHQATRMELEFRIAEIDELRSRVDELERLSELKKLEETVDDLVWKVDCIETDVDDLIERTGGPL